MNTRKKYTSDTFKLDIIENGLKLDFNEITFQLVFLVLFLPPYSSILEDPQIIKNFKGVYNVRPPSQKIVFFWDVNILFDYFYYKGENDQLSDQSLTQKLLILLLKLGGQKMNTVYFFTVDRMTVTDIELTIFI